MQAATASQQQTALVLTKTDPEPSLVERAPQATVTLATLRHKPRNSGGRWLPVNAGETLRVTPKRGKAMRIEVRSESLQDGLGRALWGDGARVFAVVVGWSPDQGMIAPERLTLDAWVCEGLSSATSSGDAEGLCWILDVKLRASPLRALRIGVALYTILDDADPACVAGAEVEARACASAAAQGVPAPAGSQYIALAALAVSHGLRTSQSGVRKPAPGKARSAGSAAAAVAGAAAGADATSSSTAPTDAPLALPASVSSSAAAAAAATAASASAAPAADLASPDFSAAVQASQRLLLEQQQQQQQMAQLLQLQHGQQKQEQLLALQQRQQQLELEHQRLQLQIQEQQQQQQQQQQQHELEQAPLVQSAIPAPSSLVSCVAGSPSSATGSVASPSSGASAAAAAAEAEASEAEFRAALDTAAALSASSSRSPSSASPGMEQQQRSSSYDAASDAAVAAVEAEVAAAVAGTSSGLTGLTHPVSADVSGSLADPALEPPHRAPSLSPFGAPASETLPSASAAATAGAPGEEGSSEVPMTVTSGDLFVNGRATAHSFLQFSDARLKADIQDIAGAMATVAKLSGKTFRWKADFGSVAGAQGARGDAVVTDRKLREQKAAQGKKKTNGATSSRSSSNLASDAHIEHAKEFLAASSPSSTTSSPTQSSTGASTPNRNVSSGELEAPSSVSSTAGGAVVAPKTAGSTGSRQTRLEAEGLDANGRRVVGLIAQEVAEVLPEVVHVDEETGLMSVGYVEILPVLIEAHKEMAACWDADRARFARKLRRLETALDISATETGATASVSASTCGPSPPELLPPAQPYRGITFDASLDDSDDDGEAGAASLVAHQARVRFSLEEEEVDSSSSSDDDEESFHEVNIADTVRRALGKAGGGSAGKKQRALSSPSSRSATAVSAGSSKTATREASRDTKKSTAVSSSRKQEQRRHARVAPVADDDDDDDGAANESVEEAPQRGRQRYSAAAEGQSARRRREARFRRHRRRARELYPSLSFSSGATASDSEVTRARGERQQKLAFPFGALEEGGSTTATNNNNNTAEGVSGSLWVQLQADEGFVAHQLAAQRSSRLSILTVGSVGWGAMMLFFSCFLLLYVPAAAPLGVACLVFGFVALGAAAVFAWRNRSSAVVSNNDNNSDSSGNAALLKSS